MLQIAEAVKQTGHREKLTIMKFIAKARWVTVRELGTSHTIQGTLEEKHMGVMRA